MSRVYIVRHGNTFAAGEPARRIGARTDTPLVASGIAQGGALGRWYAAQGVRFDRVLASPLRRTRETAALILARQPHPPGIEAAAWLAEIDHGPDENRTEDAIVARIGAQALLRWDMQSIAPPGWQVDAPSRLAAWRSLFADMATRPDETTLIVTSNGAARFALMADPRLLGAAATLPSLKLRTGAWGEIAIPPAGPMLRAWDRRPSDD